MKEQTLGLQVAWDLRKFFSDFPNLDLRTTVEREYRNGDDMGLYSITKIRFDTEGLTIKEVARE